MKDTTAAVGTSIDVLQAYPLATLEVETPNGRGLLIGLRLSQDGDRFIPNVDCYKDGIGNGYFMREVVPVLRPFSQLCDPLPDGTVPAVEVAKLLVNDWAGEYRYAARATPHGFNVDVFGLAGYMEDDEVQEFAVLLYSDWDWEIKRVGEDVEYSPTHNPAQAIDYLRSKHFAVGLEPHQYIAKEPATPEKTGGAPTMQEGAIDS